MTGARKALVVANDEYLDTGLQRLQSPGQDAAALSDVLGDPAIGQFEVTVVRNAGVQELREKLDAFFTNATRTDELLVHFSCHGLKDDANDLYLAATDTRASMLASTGLPADFVARRMRASRARSIALLLDCCYGGAFERGMLARAGGDVPVLDSFGQSQLAEGAGRVVITASSAVEYAFESGDLTDAGEAEPSVFTAAIVEGIATGDADSDGTGMISVRELFAYAERHVRQVNPHQTPHLWSFGTRGDIMVARTPLRRIVPSTLPVSVQTALAGDRISRLGAVHVLSELLDEPDPSTALAAVQALQYLVDDDSRSLSEAAVTNLRRVRLTAVPAAIEVQAGTTPPSAQVVLGGSVLAIAARVESSPDWIQVKQVGDQLTLTVRAVTAGDGVVRVTGPTGSVDIRVTAIAPEPAPPPEPPLVPEAPVLSGPPATLRNQPVPARQQAPARSDQPRPSPTQPAPPAPSPSLASPFGESAAAGDQGLWKLWTAAMILQLLTLALPLNHGFFLITAGSNALGVLFILIVLTAAVLMGLFARRLKRSLTDTSLVIGIVATCLSGVFGILAVVAGSAPNVGNFAAVIATILAVIAIVRTRARQSAQTSAPKDQ